VSDGELFASLGPFSVNVLADNRPPTIGGTPNPQATVGTNYSFTPTTSDPDGDVLTFSISGRPAWASFDASNGHLSGTPGSGHVGVFGNIRIAVSDGLNTAVLGPFSITVVAGNSAPRITGSPPLSVNANAPYSFTPSASDADGDVLTFSIENQPGWAAFDPATGRLSGTPGDADIGSYLDIVVEVSDGELSASLGPFTVNVMADNHPPTISGNGTATLNVGEAYEFVPTASDPDGDPLSFSIANRPSWASFDAADGRLSGTPSTGDAGISNVIIRVSDGELTSSLAAFAITVVAPNSPPTIGGTPNLQATAGTNYSFAPAASDPDGDPLTFTIANRPSWANFDAATGRLSGTPGSGDAGVYSNVIIHVSDGQLTSSLAAFAITVVLPNSPPTINGNPQPSVNVNTPYLFTPVASDPDGDPLTFSIANRPSWANFDAATGRLSGTPGSGDAGVYSNVIIRVSDGELTSSLAAFEITVIAPNSRPTIGGTPNPQVTVGTSYSFTPSASDPDGDVLTFSISGRPAWASFDASNGRLSGTPGIGNVGVFSNIRITATDGVDTAVLGPFSITVVAANSAPRINGNPPLSVNANASYSFTPSASDPDGDVLTFSIENQPGWAAFDPASGRLSGTPGDADVGVYDGIRISVTDGQASAALNPYSITVNAISNASVTLTWDAPTLNTDGSPLTDLAGYKLYWGTSPGNYTNSVMIGNPSVTTYVIENLAPGDYEFVATAVNSDDRESSHSNVAVFSVR
jgi:hypothetical protein